MSFTDNKAFEQAASAGMIDVASSSSSSSSQAASAVKADSAATTAVVAANTSAAEASVMALDADDEKQGNETVLLRSKDGDVRAVKRAICMQSELLKTMLTNDKDADECPLPQVSTKMLDLIISYLTYHHENAAVEIEKPLKSANISEVVCKWDAEFIDVSQEMLFEFILAANFMDMKALLDLACAKVASMIKGKNPEQIRQTFNIVNDFTPEEEAIVMAENKWAEEE